MGTIPRPPADRFWEKVDKNGPIPEARPGLGPCWVWTANKVHNGYGRFKPTKQGRKVKAHTWAYEAEIGPVPKGLELDHLCRNRACVNPSHLEPVTHRENLMRGNSIVAQAARKTHCPNGHEYSPENTRMGREGDRQCWLCKQARDRARQQRKRALARVG